MASEPYPLKEPIKSKRAIANKSTKPSKRALGGKITKLSKRTSPYERPIKIK